MALITGFVILLMLGFWMVGARNRLVRLRQAVVQSFPALELQLRKRHALARHLAEASWLAEAVPRETSEAAKAAARQAAAALDAVQSRAAMAQPMRQLAAAEEVMAAALQPLMPPSPAPPSPPQSDVAPAAQAPEPPPPVDPAMAELQARLMQLHAPLDYARQSYNGAVQGYNAALRVFPTTLVARLFAFRAAALLPRLSRSAT